METQEPLIRRAVMADAEQLTAVEAACFPSSEAATGEQIMERLSVYGSHFIVMEEGGRIISFVDGMTTDRPDLTDDMFADSSLHDEGGAWQMIFGVCTLPAYRGRGCAGTLLRQMIAQARREGRKGLVLTCKEHLVPWYAGFGFLKEGVSSSVHGGATWYQMRLTF